MNAIILCEFIFVSFCSNGLFNLKLKELEILFSFLGMLK